MNTSTTVSAPPRTMPPTSPRRFILRDTGRHCWLAAPWSPVPKLVDRPYVEWLKSHSPSVAAFTLVACSTPRAYKIARLRYAAAHGGSPKAGTSGRTHKGGRR